jgi:putative transposase
MRNEHTTVSIRWLCSFFGKSRTAYYQIIRRQTTATVNTELIVDYVKQIRKMQPRIGGRKLHHMLQPHLKQSAIRCGRDKLFRLLRSQGLLIRRRRRHYYGTQSVSMSRRFPNLLIGLQITNPEHVWVSDMTAIATRDGFAYLALITDAYSKQVMGFQLQRSKDRSCSLAALKMALRRRWYPEQRLVHHSDGGGEYFNHDYLNMLTKAHCQISCTAPASPQENPIAERINGILKNELLPEEEHWTFDEMCNAIPRAVKIYNELRPHASCDFMTPVQAHSCNGPLQRRWKSYPKKGNWRDNTISHIGAQIQREMQRLGCPTAHR